MRARLLVVVGMALLGCAGSPGRDGGEDASADAGPSVFDAGTNAAVFDAGDLPAVLPSGVSCPVDAGRNRDCVPEGWFVLSRWSSWERPRHLADGGPDRSTLQPVYLDPFLIDRFEVTNEEWHAFVRDGGATAPPTTCGCTQVDPEQPLVTFDEVSGWDGGQPDPARASHPVVCVTRAEAMRFCEARGGRLPSLVETLKAARGAYPSTQMFPWGFAPLSWYPTGTLSAPTNYVFEFNAIGLRDFGKLNTVPVGSRRLGGGPFGTMDLAGNVSEFTLECLEEVERRFPPGGGIIRPSMSWSPTCNRASVVVGDNWFSAGGYGLTAYRFSYYTDYLGTPGCGPSDYNPLCRELAGLVGFGEPHCTSPQPPPDTPANELRSWSVGFRCVYPLR